MPACLCGAFPLSPANSPRRISPRANGRIFSYISRRSSTDSIQSTTNISHHNKSNLQAAMAYRFGTLTIFAAALIFLCLTTLNVRAQVTFSRDWNPGKRTLDTPDWHGSLKSATTICHLLVDQIRQLANCESARNEEMDQIPTTGFNGRR